MKYKSDILEMIHENATANYKIGAISEERMREYDVMCLEEEPKAIKRTEHSFKETENIDLAIIQEP